MRGWRGHFELASLESRIPGATAHNAVVGLANLRFRKLAIIAT